MGLIDKRNWVRS